MFYLLTYLLTHAKKENAKPIKQFTAANVSKVRNHDCSAKCQKQQLITKPVLKSSIELEIADDVNSKHL